MEKIVPKTPNWAKVFMTAYLLWVTGATAQKVYFDCGAVVDVVDMQGLVLSPGFPYNYSSGTHCVWQFFVPVGYQLVMEILDFDVFENHDILARSADDLQGGVEEEEYDGDYVTPSKGPPLQGPLGATASISPLPQKEAVNQMVVVQEQSTKMEMAKVSNSAKWNAESPLEPSPLPQLYSQPPGDRQENSISHQALRGDGDPDPRVVLSRGADHDATPTSTPPPTPPFPTDEESTLSTETGPPVTDACPHDVLYISDLITFSSRFCGSRTPRGLPLAFGSAEEMVEVIMELITTTHWGRGFALLFRYHNHTEPGDQRLLTPPAAATAKMDALVAAVCGAALFAVVLTSALCLYFRPKLCTKKASTSSSGSSEPQEDVPSPGRDASELQLVPPSQSGPEVPANQEDPEHTPATARLQSGSPISAGADISQNSEPELSPHGLAELELGTDEVFVISSGPSASSRLPLSPYTHRERLLRHSDTGPGPGCDWLSTNSPADQPVGGRSSQGGGASSTRPRAWSVRTFQDFLPPLPQLHRKWRSWNSASPFTKLVDSAPAGSEGPRKILSDTHLETGTQADSCGSTASYPLSHVAQRQRRLNSVSNLRRSRFAAPCFSLPENGAGPRPQSPPIESASRADFPGESEHVSVPVFAISEEEDRQPLVMAEHLGQPPVSTHLSNGLGQESDGTRTQARGRSPGAQSRASSADPTATNGALLPRARSDQWPWESHTPSENDPFHSARDTEVQALKSTLVHSTANQIKPASLSQSTEPCRVVGKEM
ncbi:hypothetical protein GJAV_G00033370 [Gymnothorax javanicus]|nr:hypothetical protein GJAV_G00033370 [Gymnothorax javanicus]